MQALIEPRVDPKLHEIRSYCNAQALPREREKRSTRADRQTDSLAGARPGIYRSLNRFSRLWELFQTVFKPELQYTGYGSSTVVLALSEASCNHPPIAIHHTSTINDHQTPTQDAVAHRNADWGALGLRACQAWRRLGIRAKPRCQFDRTVLELRDMGYTVLPDQEYSILVEMR